MQVYADEECTIRPQVGQTYAELWVKVNRTVAREEAYNWGDIDEQYTVAAIAGASEDPGWITCYVDMSSEEFDGAIAPGVYSISGAESITITAPLVVDFYD